MICKSKSSCFPPDIMSHGQVSRHCSVLCRIMSSCMWLRCKGNISSLTQNERPKYAKFPFNFWLLDNHPRTTHCSGDIVTLLWFRAFVRGPCEHDRDYTVSCFFVKLGIHVNHDERMIPVDFGGQRSRSQWTYMEISLWTQWRLHRFMFLCQSWQTC